MYFSPSTAVKCAVLACCLTLGACGQRGDLYLPTTPDRASLGDTLVTAPTPKNSTTPSDTPRAAP